MAPTAGLHRGDTGAQIVTSPDANTQIGGYAGDTSGVVTCQEFKRRAQTVARICKMRPKRDKAERPERWQAATQQLRFLRSNEVAPATTMALSGTRTPFARATWWGSLGASHKSKRGRNEAIELRLEICDDGVVYFGERLDTPVFRFHMMQEQLRDVCATVLQFAQASAQVVAVVNLVQHPKQFRETGGEHTVLLAHELRKASFLRTELFHRS